MCGLGFGKWHCTFGGVTRVAWFALRVVGDDAAAEQSVFTISKRDTRCIVGRGDTDHDLLDLTIAQLTDSYAYQSY